MDRSKVPRCPETGPKFSSQDDRVTLTDGGVYDNLGVAPLWPDRDPSISVAIPKPDIIVACRAGYGLRFGLPTVTLLGRMTASFYTTLDRAQNAALKRLYDLTRIIHQPNPISSGREGLAVLTGMT